MPIIAMQSTEQMNQALQNCLQLCSRAPFPLICLWEYLMILRTKAGWGAEDLAALRSMVVRFLTNVQRQDQPGDSGMLG